jgi:hypothetical protein
MTLLLWISWVAGVLAVAALALHVLGSKLWAGRMANLANSTDGLQARNQEGLDQPRPNATTQYDPHELDGLPAPVQRYLRAVLQPGQPIIGAVTVEMAGTINMSATGEQWKPFTSVQRVVTASAHARSGFMWDARIAMLPGIKVHVLDAYIAGKGLVRAAVLGLFKVADMGGGGEMARGEFMRFFAETPWYPTALLPSQGVQWVAVDDSSATAHITDGAITLTMLFHFNDAGLIDRVRAEARGGMVDNKMLLRPWECGLSNYQVQSGMTVPLCGTAAWVLPGGSKTYFHGTVKSLVYEWRSMQAQAE